LPICLAHDLFSIKTPDWVVQKLYNFRPYKPQDETAVYNICLKTCDDRMDGTEVFPDFPQLLGDRLIGNFVAFSPEYSFVTEDEEGVCGYAVAALDAKVLAEKSNKMWVAAMKDKYPKPSPVTNPAEEMMATFHTEAIEVKEDVYQYYPSVLRLDVMISRMYDPAVPHRLLAATLCALKGAGSKGVHTKLNSADKFMVDFYTKLGFTSIVTTDSPAIVYMGRAM